MAGVRGDVILVNGAVSPAARPPRTLVRLRILNGSNARLYHLSFADNRSFHWIAAEGGLLERAVAMRRITLAPAQRAEILVDFSDGRAVDLLTGADDNLPMGRGMMGGGGPGMMMGSTPAGRVMRFEPAGRTEPTRPIPSTLARWSRPDRARAVRRRKLTLTMGMGMGMGMGGRGRGRMGPGGPGMSGMGAHGIDGRPFDMDRIDQRVKLGDVEIWEVASEMMQHPFHMHGVHFEVLSRGGRAPELGDQGRRDTVLVQDAVELLVRFTQPAPKTPFMYHCHILEHEDHGMMGQYLTA
jgi:FtsP/CotA-like multicopper oxidase with cupredoxin domain